MRRVHVVVRGEVQGVGYRYTMRIVAREAGAAGWVRNRRDGTVEAEVEGTDAQADEVLFFDHGVIVERGAPKQLFTAPQQERTRRFVERILHPLDD